MIIGASANSLFQWESGKAEPRAATKAKIIAMRELGRREVKKLLAGLAGKNGEHATAKKTKPAKSVGKRRAPRKSGKDGAKVDAKPEAAQQNVAEVLPPKES